MVTESDLYLMKIHDVLIISSNKVEIIKVLRVPGGWIYITITINGIAQTFIPLSSE